MAAVHSYQTSLSWSGSTGAGYRAYPRAHQVSIPKVDTELLMSADPSYLGDAAKHNPEQLLLAAASSCQLLSFLALAARAGINVVTYDDDADATMPIAREPMRITRITLRPRIRVGAGTDVARVLDLVHAAHDQCYIANTLNAQMVLEPSVEVAATAPT